MYILCPLQTFIIADITYRSLCQIVCDLLTNSNPIIGLMNIHDSVAITSIIIVAYGLNCLNK